VVGPGGTSTKTVAADSTGTAQWSYRIGAQGPTGIYTVTASTTWNSQMASASASFTVK
jgi:hypothetical protein